MTATYMPSQTVAPMTTADAAGQSYVLAAVKQEIRALREASRSAAQRTWALLLVMGENKAKYHRSL